MMSRLVLLLVVLGAVAGGGETRQAAFDKEDDDDFAEFDFDVEEEWEGDLSLISAPPTVDMVCSALGRF